jgi:hypothetical protein
MLDRQVTMRVVVRVCVIGAPAIRPDSRRAEQLATGSQDDAERLVVQD